MDTNFQITANKAASAASYPIPEQQRATVAASSASQISSAQPEQETSCVYQFLISIFNFIRSLFCGSDQQKTLKAALMEKFSPTVQELMRRVPAEEFFWKEFERISVQQDFEKNVNSLAEAWNVVDLDAAIFKDKDYPYYALGAVAYPHLVKGKSFSIAQFASLMYLWKVLSSEDLLDVKNIKRLDEQDLEEHLEYSAVVSNHSVAYRVNPSYLKMLTPMEIDLAISNMKAQPYSEQQIFIIPLVHPDICTKRRNIRNALWKNLGVSLLSYSVDVRKQNILLMVPSLTWMENTLEALAKKHGRAVRKLNPVLGLSTPEDLMQSFCQFKRDFAIPFPGISYPKTVDNQPNEEAGFPFHDYVHAIYNTFIFEDLIPPLKALRDFLRLEINRTSSQEEIKFLEKLCESIADGENFIFSPPYLAYRPEENRDLSSLFWAYLTHDLIGTAQNRLGKDMAALQRRVFENLLTHIQKENWEDRFSITSDAIEKETEYYLESDIRFKHSKSESLDQPFKILYEVFQEQQST